MFGILALGDSIVFGRGTVPSNGWTSRIKKYFESKEFHNVVYNLGIPGDSSSGLVKRFETECRARVDNTWPGSKFVILIGVGMNDICYAKTSDNPKTKPVLFKKNILKLIKLAKKYTKDVVFVGITPVDEKSTMPWEGMYYSNEMIKEYNSLILNCCKKEGVLFVDLFGKMPRYRELLVDGIHPNEKGYEKMYKVIKKFWIDNKLID